MPISVSVTPATCTNEYGLGYTYVVSREGLPCVSGHLQGPRMPDYLCLIAPYAGLRWAEVALGRDTRVPEECRYTSFQSLMQHNMGGVFRGVP